MIRINIDAIPVSETDISRLLYIQSAGWIYQPRLYMMTIEQIASTAHEVNRAYCLAIGDDSQPSWTDAPDWQKDSAIKGVEFHLTNPDAKPEDSHNSWLKQKQEDGWKYGPVKNPETKEHPCFLPYKELPQEQRVKDYLFIAVVESLSPLIAIPQPDEKQPEQQEEAVTEAISASRPLTEGEQIVDVNFAQGDVLVVKNAFAHAIDTVISSVERKLKVETNLVSPSDAQKALTNKVNRLKALAITNTEMACMQAVKAITR